MHSLNFECATRNKTIKASDHSRVETRCMGEVNVSKLDHKSENELFSVAFEFTKREKWQEVK